MLNSRDDKTYPWRIYFKIKKSPVADLLCIGRELIAIKMFNDSYTFTTHIYWLRIILKSQRVYKFTNVVGLDHPRIRTSQNSRQKSCVTI